MHLNLALEGLTKQLVFLVEFEVTNKLDDMR